MTLLRFITLAFLGFLLLIPVIKTTTYQTQKPIIVFAQDNSSSMAFSADSVFIKDSLNLILDPLIASISDGFDVRKIQFGDSIADVSGTFSDKETNFESLFDEFSTTYFNQNIGALVIFSDGIYNKGTQPLYAAQALPFPIYTVPFGDTLANSDIAIIKAEYNSVAYKSSNFPVKIGVTANLLKGNNIAVDIYNEGKLIATKDVGINTDNFFKNVTFYLNADSVGIFSYKILARSEVKEKNILNNSKTIYVEVEESKRKILLLHNGYHPDLAVFKRIVDANSAFDIDVVNSAEYTGSVSDYSLVILHQLPSLRNSLQNIWTDILKNEPSILFVLGAETSVAALNNLSLPLNINQKTALFDEVVPNINSGFNLFNLSLDEQFLTEMPPLNVPFGEYIAAPNSQVLLYQQLGQIETKKPLWMFSEKGNQKVGFIMGEGLWKWSLQEYKKYKEHSVSNEMVNKTIQYLALKDKKNPFVIEYSRIQSENQEVVFTAKLLNASNELVKGANIQFDLVDDNGNIYPHSFKELVDEYNLNLGLLGVGTYKFQASTRLGNQDLTKSGTFIVKENLIEQSNLIADYNMLYKLSVVSNGKQFNKNNLPDLFVDLENNANMVSLNYYQKILKDLINLKILLIIFVLLLTLEWFFRKFWGLV